MNWTLYKHATIHDLLTEALIHCVSFVIPVPCRQDEMVADCSDSDCCYSLHNWDCTLDCCWSGGAQPSGWR